ncbi:MAG: VWA domain-containing protein [Deltaproteobacteria bacterium]|nr:VWA domain-containing protein [Deltaproteobacteria bacterium]
MSLDRAPLRDLGRNVDQPLRRASATLDGACARGPTLLVAVLFLSSAATRAEAPTAVPLRVAPFVATDEATESKDLHRILRELVVHELMSSRKFVPSRARFDEPLSASELVLTASVSSTSSGHLLGARLASQHGQVAKLSFGPEASVEVLANGVARAIGQLNRRKGHVVKREADRIVVAAGRRDGLVVGQRYRTTDTFEEFVIERVSEETSVGRVVVSSGASPAEGIGLLDVVFVLDVSGSMQGEIDGVVTSCSAFSRRLRSAQIDARLGIVTFLDRVTLRQSPDGDPVVLANNLAPIRAGGRVNETPFTAVKAALALEFRPSAKRVLILVTDEPAYDAVSSECRAGWAACSRETADRVFSRGLAKSLLEELERTESVVLAVTLDDPQGLYRALAEKSGGLFMPLDRATGFDVILRVLGRRIEGMFVEM